MKEADAVLLQFILSRIQTLSDEHWHTFTSSRKAMDDHAWVGGTSSHGFAGKLERNDAALHAELRKALQLVQDKLRQ
ncbi:hypothetical protein [Actinomadura rubrisoli]|uniref:Uncharacterized protein n=1 Tax=Actinomadura rubrisoli TaxID=2530368 RepID=A0A4R5C9N1_9ACTN|nr:hypothetical protein [Actinomadura rubrisoli]TDD93722.1 hypothetical protein E1298_08710 [Actinomadura rubrisoli]